jgi:hypothetical protein
MPQEPEEPAQIALPDELLDYLRQQQLTGPAQRILLNEMSDYFQKLQTSGPTQAILPPELTNYFQQHQMSSQVQEAQLRDLLNYLEQQQQAKGPSGSTPAPQIVLKNNPKALDSFNKQELELIAQSNNITFKEADPSKKDIYTKLLQLGLIPVSKRTTPTISGLAVAEPEVIPPPLRRSARLNPPDPTNPTGSGLGVHLKKLPKVIKLGHIHINPSNLYYEHILSVRNPKNKPLRAYKDEHVSAYLASLLIKLIEGGTIKKYELQPLSDHEKMIYDNLIKRSKLHTMNDNTFETTAGKMKDRLMVLEGELEAGNTNKLIKEEIHGLLFKLAHAKVISNVDATRHWKSLNEIY